MSRFLLFAGNDYYPAGGWGDFKGDFDTQEEAEAFLANSTQKFDWKQIIDTADSSNFPNIT